MLNVVISDSIGYADAILSIGPWGSFTGTNITFQNTPNSTATARRRVRRDQRAGLRHAVLQLHGLPLQQLQQHRHRRRRLGDPECQARHGSPRLQELPRWIHWMVPHPQARLRGRLLLRECGWVHKQTSPQYGA